MIRPAAGDTSPTKRWGAASKSGAAAIRRAFAFSSSEPCVMAPQRNHLGARRGCPRRAVPVGHGSTAMMRASIVCRTNPSPQALRC